MSARQTAMRLTRGVGGRAVHLRLFPRPEGISESREILRLLQGYGKVEMFKNLKYDALPTSNTMLAIFQTEEAARALLRSSPLRFNMSRDQVDNDIVVGSDASHDNSTLNSSSSPNQTYDSHATHQYPEGLNASQSSQHAQSLSSPLEAALLQSSSSDRDALAETAAQRISAQSRASLNLSGRSASPQTRKYQLQVNISTMHHRDHLNANPYNGPFVVDSKSAVQQDLAKRVPLIGLSDVNLKKPEKPWRVLLWERAREGKRRNTLRQMLRS